MGGGPSLTCNLQCEGVPPTAPSKQLVRLLAIALRLDSHTCHPICLSNIPSSQREIQPWATPPPLFPGQLPCWAYSSLTVPTATSPARPGSYKGLSWKPGLGPHTSLLSLSPIEEHPQGQAFLSSGPLFPTLLPCPVYAYLSHLFPLILQTKWKPSWATQMRRSQACRSQRSPWKSRYGSHWWLGLWEEWVELGQFQLGTAQAFLVPSSGHWIS